MRPVEGAIIADRFQLIRELGHGAMGSVWLAHHLTLEVRCAVKFIAGEFVSDPKYRAQFHLEAHTVAKVQSPHVVRVLDHDICGDAPYIALEYLDGEDLRARLLRERRLSPLATHKVVSQIARGLSKAHAAGIVHRDLKPENIFFAREGDEEVVKLLDFGTAKWGSLSVQAGADERLEGLIGTPEYMSPEQACGGTVDHRSDFWSLAVVAYECLTGRFAFEGASIAELLSRITRGALPVPSEFAPQLPPAVDDWWARAVSRNIDARFQSAGALADALGHALGLSDARAEETLSPPAPIAQRRRRGRAPWLRLSLASAALGVAFTFAIAGRPAAPNAGTRRAAVAAPRAVEMPAGAPRPALVRVDVLVPRPVPGPPPFRMAKHPAQLAPRFDSGRGASPGVACHCPVPQGGGRC